MAFLNMQSDRRGMTPEEFYNDGGCEAKIIDNKLPVAIASLALKIGSADSRPKSYEERIAYELTIDDDGIL